MLFPDRATHEMKLIDCPQIGLRPASEFAYGGPLRPMPDPAQCGDGEWARYVFNRPGAPGVKREWWCHLPSGIWFIAERDTVNDVFLRSLSVAEGLDA
jgi:sarcosine oxidase subunit delta